MVRRVRLTFRRRHEPHIFASSKFDCQTLHGGFPDQFGVFGVVKEMSAGGTDNDP